MPNGITTELIESAYTYASYRKMINENFAQGKTTGDNHSEAMLHYTKMNIRRMERLDKSASLSDELLTVVKAIQKPQIWLVFTEAWCGDAAQNLPIINALAEQNTNIVLRLILRDEHPEVMGAYLTKGTRSIPKVVMLEAKTLEELNVWGPRPAAAQAMVEEHKVLGTDHDTYITLVHKWYNANKTVDLQQEFIQLLQG